MPIKHLVLSGGGPIMIQVLSALQELERHDVWSMNTIETIYGTSAGAIVGVLLALQFPWETLNDYIIKRPWKDVFPLHIQAILDAYSKKGVFDLQTIHKCFKPLFDAKDISLDITLQSFYQLTHKEIHVFTFEVNSYTIVDVSYKTHPDLPLLTAIHMTCAIPILVTPVCISDQCFMDGGIACNYPLNFCIESGANTDEILGCKNRYSDDRSAVDASSTMVDYLLHLLFKSLFHVRHTYVQPSIPHEIVCDASYLTLDVLKHALYDIDVRKELFEKGKTAAADYLKK